MATPPQQPVTDPLGRQLTRACPVCGWQVALDAPFCPHCGTSLRTGSGPTGPMIVAGVLAIVVGVLLALLLTRDDDDEPPATTTPTTLSVTVPTVTTAPTITTPAATFTTPPTTITTPTAPPPGTTTSPAQTGATNPTATIPTIPGATTTTPGD